MKSYLDSKGVIYEEVVQEQEEQSGGYKLLTSENYRNVLTDRLLIDWEESGIIPKKVKVNYGLIAGKIYSTKKNPDREKDLKEYFKKKGWFFMGPEIIKEKITELSKKRYENNSVVLVSKILMRD